MCAVVLRACGAVGARSRWDWPEARLPPEVAFEPEASPAKFGLRGFG
jgi:hypothetical protein